MARKPTTRSQHDKSQKAKQEAMKAWADLAESTLQLMADRLKAMDKAHIDLHNMVGELKCLLQEMTDFLTVNIRLKTWPMVGLGIGLQVHEIDEILSQALAARLKAGRVLRKHKHLFPQAETHVDQRTQTPHRPRVV